MNDPYESLINQGLFACLFDSNGNGHTDHRVVTRADKVAFKKRLEKVGIRISAEWAGIVKLPQEGSRIITFNNQYNVQIDNPKAFSDAVRRARIECVEIAEQMKVLDEYKSIEILSV